MVRLACQFFMETSVLSEGMDSSSHCTQSLAGDLCGEGSSGNVMCLIVKSCKGCGHSLALSAALGHVQSFCLPQILVESSFSLLPLNWFPAIT